MTALREQHEAKMQSTQAHINNLAHNITSSINRGKELKGNLIRITNEISKNENQLQNIQAQRDNKLILFGEAFPKLVAEIERNYQKVRILCLI